MVRFLHESICWLLSAVLLLTNGWPVAIQHAHDLGENPYHHSHRGELVADAVGRMPSMGHADAAVSGVTEHVHMLWLGWEVTILPLKGARSDSSPSPVAAGMIAKVVEKCSTETDVVGVFVANTPLVCSISLPLQLDAASIRAGALPRVAALPLCDTARHLRSGVQLI
ncbi:MAG: hypothetical protein B7Z73_09700 [Planctomycetia bacterium 21-64-5]|nr:MAG: hypothetical protein B7Z73_09700 [Planctomycetia bacterium 21-64-5]